MAFGRSTAERIVGTATRAAGGAVTTKTALDGVLEAFEFMPPSAYIGAMAGSVALSIAMMLVPSERTKHWALFVGLWAPTILNLGLYSRMRRME
ncbi:MAG TPA: hypothetical protein VFD84_11535 [Candidatus Binatia bacterium]|nr:hypothetical protein [Candidatus Binatia bacterium]